MALQVRLEGRKIALRVRAKGSAQLDLIGHAALAHVAGKRAANSAARRAVARLEAAVDAPGLRLAKLLVVRAKLCVQTCALLRAKSGCKIGIARRLTSRVRFASRVARFPATIARVVCPGLAKEVVNVLHTGAILCPQLRHARIRALIVHLRLLCRRTCAQDRGQSQADGRHAMGAPVRAGSSFGYP